MDASIIGFKCGVLRRGGFAPLYECVLISELPWHYFDNPRSLGMQQGGVPTRIATATSSLLVKSIPDAGRHVKHKAYSLLLWTALMDRPYANLRLRRHVPQR